jgi:hypothetical protein
VPAHVRVGFVHVPVASVLSVNKIAEGLVIIAEAALASLEKGAKCE